MAPIACVCTKRAFFARTHRSTPITGYGSLSGALKILEAGETIDLYYVSKYPVTYHCDTAIKTDGDDLVKQGESLTFRAKPSAQDMRLKVTVNGTSVPGTVYDDETGEMIFTVNNVQGPQNVIIAEEEVEYYTLSYDPSGISNGEFKSELTQTVKAGGTVRVNIQSTYTFPETTRYVLNLLVINGHEVTTLPSDAREGDSVTSTLPSGETVTVTLVDEDTWVPVQYHNIYTVTISNVHTDLYINGGNCKDETRDEIILRELTGVDKIVGWDFDKESYVSGSVNTVYEQTGRWGNRFYFSVKPGYGEPKLTVKENGVERTIALEQNQGNDAQCPPEQYPYSFDITNELGDNVEVYLSAEPIRYEVEYRNDKNGDDLIFRENGTFTVAEGNHDTITITNRTPYDTEKGLTADGYVLEGTTGPVYDAGDTVRVADLAPKVNGSTITFVPNWVDVGTINERPITVNLYIEDPEDIGSYDKVDSYPLSVEDAEIALFRPNDARGQEHIREYIVNEVPSWYGKYNVSDFELRDGESIRYVTAQDQEINFYYDIKKGTVTVNFAWGTGEVEVPGLLPNSIDEKVAILQEYSVAIAKEVTIPEGYMVSKSVVAGKMDDEGTPVTETIYLYKDGNGDGKPDNHTITLTFDAGTDGTIPGVGQTKSYTLAKTIDGEFEGDQYPGLMEIPAAESTTEGLVFNAWLDEAGNTYASTYAGKKVSADAKDLTITADYGPIDGSKLVNISYYLEQEDGTFSLIRTISKYGKPGTAVTYTREEAPSGNYVTPHQGENGTHIVSDTGSNDVRVDYYLDKDRNGKPDRFTLTLTFKGTGHGAWDSNDPAWAGMEAGKDYTIGQGVLTVYLVKENTVEFQPDTYPTAPKVNPEKTYLFNSWQDGEGNKYEDSGLIGKTVGATDGNREYTTVYDRDLNEDGTPDDQQSVTVTFLAGEHGTLTGKTVHEGLLPKRDRYPKAPTVTTEEGWEFIGWDKPYKESQTVEESAPRNQEYTAQYRLKQTTNLEEIVNPADITGVPNGTALADMGLPGTVTIRTTIGNMQANVTWDTSSANYDPSKAEAQTFTLNGTVTLPQGVNNPGGLPLKASIRITVDAKGTVQGGNLTYYANGGSGDPVDYYTTDPVAIVSDNLWFTKVNYTFASWNTAADGSGIKYMPGNTITMNGNVDLYAQWVKNGGGDGGDGSGDGGDATLQEYELHYVTNGGKHLSVESEVRVWTKDHEDLPVPVREGYTFEGWYWDLRLTQRVTGDVKVDVPAVVLYAKWSEDEEQPVDTGVSRWLDTVNHTAYLSGYPDGTFGTDRNMTRAEVAQMFYALLLDKDVEITTSFSDVPADAWYAKAVNTLSSLGMLGGYPDGTYHPDAPITRAEFAAVALAFARESASADCSYADVNANAWYYTYVAQASSYGWIGGYPDNTFRPDNKITRAEVCVIVNNMLGRAADQRYIARNADELTSFADLTSNHWAYYTVMEATNSHKYSMNDGVESWR